MSEMKSYDNPSPFEANPVRKLTAVYTVELYADKNNVLSCASAIEL